MRRTRKYTFKNTRLLALYIWLVVLFFISILINMWKKSNDSKSESTYFMGKSLSICGDSISTFTGYIPYDYDKCYPEKGQILDVNDTWWMQVIKKTGMKLCSNASFSGSTVSGEADDMESGRWACGNRRISDLAGNTGEEPDIILILMGTNDLVSCIPLGNDNNYYIGGGYISNFSEAYALMLDKIIERYPEAQIFCCTIIEVGKWDEEGNCFCWKNDYGLTAKDYNKCIKEIADEKKLKIIDVYNCGITYKNIRQYTSDGCHPNVEGMNLIAETVYEGLIGSVK